MMAILLGKSCKSLKRGDVHMALDSPLPLLAVFTCIGNLPIPCPLLCFFKDGCAVVTGSSSPPLGTDPDYHLRNLLSSNLSLCFQVMFPQPPPPPHRAIHPSQSSGSRDGTKTSWDPGWSNYGAAHNLFWEHWGNATFNACSPRGCW